MALPRTPLRRVLTHLHAAMCPTPENAPLAYIHSLSFQLFGSGGASSRGGARESVRRTAQLSPHRLG
jgi:hypothetical protein